MTQPPVLKHISWCRPLLVASAALALPALDVGDDLVIGGFVEGYGQYQHRGAGAVDASIEGSGEDVADASAQALVHATWVVDDFTGRIDIVASSEPQFVDEGSVRLEQAVIDWQARETLTLRVGRFRNTWFGWEGFHTPEHWRVRFSAAWDWNVQNHSLLPNKPFVSDGAGLLWTDAQDRHGAEIYLVDDIFGDAAVPEGMDMAGGVSLWAKRPELGRAELAFAFDPRSSAGPAGRQVSTFGIDANAGLSAFRDQGWFFAAQVQWHHHPDLTVNGVTYGNDLILLAMANYEFMPRHSATLMIDWVERGVKADDNEVLEFALASVNRIGRHARANFEVFYWDESRDDADILGVAAVLNLELP